MKKLRKVIQGCRNLKLGVDLVKSFMIACFNKEKNKIICSSRCCKENRKIRKKIAKKRIIIIINLIF